jgi:hypothetical protein
MLGRQLLTPLVSLAVLLLACAGVPDWARYDDGSPIRADEEHEASLGLDALDSDPSLLALIHMKRGHDLCAVCALERNLDNEARALQSFLTKPQPTWATERAQNRLELINRYRGEYPFNEAECPPTPCYEESEAAAQQGVEPHVE